MSMKSHRSTRFFVFVVTCLLFLLATLSAIDISYCQILDSEARELDTKVGQLFVEGRYNEGIAIAKDLLAVREKTLGKNHPDVARSLSDLGWLHSFTGRYGEAEALFKRGLEIREKRLGKNHPDVAHILNRLALLYWNTGRYGEAVGLHKRSLEIKEKRLGRGHTAVAYTLNNLALLYGTTGRYDEAEALYRRSLEIYEKRLRKDHPEVATSLNNLALLFQAIGRYGDAEPLLKRSLEIREKMFRKNHPNVAMSRNNLALLLLDSGKWEEAYEIFSRQNSKSGLGKCHLVKKGFEEAARLFSLSLEKVNKRNPRPVIGLQIGLGLSYEGMGEYAKSGEHFRGAIEVIEAEWKTLDPEAKKEFLNAKVDLGFSRLEAYEGLARVLLKLGDKESMGEALRVSERVKSRVLLEMLATREVRGKTPEDEALLRQDREHQRGLMEVRKRIEILGEMRQMDQEVPRGEVDRLQSILGQKEKTYGKFIEEVKLKNSELSSLISVDPPPYSQIQSLLDPDVDLLEYYTTKEKIYAWLVSREDIRVYEMGIPEKELKEKVDRLLLPNMSNRPRKAEPVIVYVGKEEKETGESEREENRKRFQSVSKELYEAVIAPVSNDIKTKNLIVVPHGVLHKVPFGALTDGSSYLIDKYTISVLPSASVLEHVVKKTKEAKDKALVLANPKTEHVALGFAEAEGRMLESVFPSGETYYREKATETTAKLRASDFNVIHFATHGEFNERQPMQSGLLLAKDDKNDGYLQVHEVFGMDLKAANLVTLSACETALSKVQGGDDLVGLSRGFIYAGTPSILATLWKVDDASTAKLMEIFYRNWKSGMSKAEALRHAQETVRKMKGYEHPFYWAPFIMIGDWK
jgi:CHAT domain-containing protein/tetratricopeptide (TPR) repeat protein